MSDQPQALAFEAEVRLLRWSESSTAGRTITLELPPDQGDAHPFRGLPTGHQNGQRFMMSFAAIDDDETRRDPAAGPLAAGSPGPADAPPSAGAGATNTEMPPASAPIVGGNARLPRASPDAPQGANHKDLSHSLAGKQRYAEADERERAVTRAGMLANDRQFQAWAAKKSGFQASPELGASCIRAMCNISSRKEIALSDRAYTAFLELETEFERDTNRIAEIR